MPRIFLSHSAADNRETLALWEWLVSRDRSLERQIFLDLKRMKGGEEWRKTLQRNLESCQALLCLISKDWEASFECGGEYNYAVSQGKTIFCARLDPSAGLGEISRLQRRELYAGNGQPTTSIDLKDGQPPVVFSTDGLERLLRDLQSRHIGADSFTWPPPDEPNRAPYRGWLPFEPQDAAIFFGRDSELRSALDAFDEMHSAGHNRLFVILGPSGTGKSSFLRAGILPRLNLHRDRFILLDIVRPGRGEALTGASGLANAIFMTRKRLGLATPPPGEIKNQGINDAAKVRQLLIECQDEAMKRSIDPTTAPTLVLPVDQAEELFSAEAGQEAIGLLELMRELLVASDRAADGPRLRLVIAATIRTDRYEVMQTAEELSGVETMLFNDLKPMRRDRFRQVIEGPARQSTEGGHRLTVEGPLVDRLLTDATANTTAGGDTLPLLSGTLARLFADYGDTGELTVQQYEQMGGLHRVVQTEIDKILSADKSVRATQLAMLHEAFIPWLATVSDSNEPMRRIALWTDLPEPSRELVEKFVDARILIRDKRELRMGKGNAQDVVEIALESFLRQWDELSSWLRDQADDLKAADDLVRDAHRWQAHDRDPAYLHPDTLLNEAESLAATPTFGRKLEPAREYLVASRQGASQQQRDKEAALRRNALRLRLVLAVTVVVAVAAVAGLFYAVYSQQVAKRSARDATGQKLVSNAQAILADTREGDDVRAFQELLAAHELATDPNDTPLLETLVKRSSTELILGTREPVIGVAFAERPQRLVMAESGSIRVWDTNSPTWRDSIRDKGGLRLAEGLRELTSVAISPDGSRVAAGSGDGKVQLWNVGDERPVATQVGEQHVERVTSVAFSRDGSRLASASVDGTIDLSNADGSNLRSIDTDKEIFTVALSPTGDRLAAGGADGSILVWETDKLPAAGGKIPPALTTTAHAGGVSSVTFSPRGDLIASGGADNLVRLWNSATLDGIGPMTPSAGQGHTAAVTSVAFNADGNRVVSGGNDKTVQLWDIAGRQRVGDPMIGHEGLVLSVAFVGNEIVSGGNEHTMRLWNVDPGQPVSAPMTGHAGAVTSVAISLDGDRIASGGVDGTVRLWSSDTGGQIKQMPGPAGVITTVAFHPKEDTVASGSADGTIRLWHLSADTVTTFQAGRPISAIALNRDGDRLASAGLDGQVTLWELPSGHQTALDNKDQAAVSDVAFDPEGERLASGSITGTLRVWQVEGGRQLWEKDAADALPEKFAADENLAVGHPGAILSVAFSPDGQRLASGSADWTPPDVGAPDGGAVGVVQYWDAGDGRPLDDPILLGHAVMGLAFSESADAVTDWVAAASFDPYDVRLLNAGSAAGAQFTFQGHQAQVVSVATTTDGGRLVSGSADGTVRIWPNLPGIPAHEALCAKLTANMSHDEWQRWVSKDIDYRETCPGLPIAENAE